MSKKLLSERDICIKYISPAIENSGWTKLTQNLEEVSFTDGKKYVKGRLTTRGACKRADYILYFKPNIQLTRLSDYCLRFWHIPKPAAFLSHLMQLCDELETSLKQSQQQNKHLLQQVLKEALEVKEELLA